MNISTLTDDELDALVLATAQNAAHDAHYDHPLSINAYIIGRELRTRVTYRAFQRISLSLERLAMAQKLTRGELAMTDTAPYYNVRQS